MTGLLDAISHALARWVSLLLRFRRAAILGSLVLAGLCLDYTIDNLGINTDTANMISDRLPWRQQFIAYRNAFPVRDRNLIALVESDSPAAAEAYAAAFAAALRDEPDLFESVFLPGDGDFFERNGLLYLNLDELDNLSDRLIDAQPMLGVIQRRANGTGVVEMITETITADDLPSDSAELQSFYERTADVLFSAAAGKAEPFDWGAMISTVEDPGPRLVVLVQPRLDFNRVQPARPAIERMRAIANEIAAEIAVPVSMRLTGTLAMEHEELESVTRGAGAAGIAALLMVSAVLFWALRSVVLLVISIVSLLVGLIGTATFAAAAVGHLNLLSVAFAVLYVGLGVDFILHISLRLKELVAEGADVESAIERTTKGVGASLVVCALTTAAGFYAFIPTPFEGVSELGLISGTGMFISLFVSVTLLPALLAEFCGPRSLAHRARTPAVTWWSGPGTLPRYTIAACGLLLVVCAIAVPGVSFDSNPVNLRDPDSESVQALEELAASSDAQMLSLVAIAGDSASASAWAAELGRLEVVSGVLTADSLVPGQQDDKLFLLEDLAFVLGPTLGSFDVRESRPDVLREALRELSQALAEKPVRSEVEERLAEALDEFSDSLRETSDSDGKLVDLGAALIGDLPARLESLRTALGAEAFGRSALPPELTDRWFDDSGRELIEIVPAENVNDNEAAARFVDEVRAVLPSATGLPVVYREASRTVVLSFQLALFYAFVLVSLILTLLMRSLRDATLVLAPILFAAIVTAGATAWLGIPFNFANIIALPLLVGVGVDNGIHMVHRMRTEPPRDGDPLHTSTSRAVLASGLTTIASFGNLAFASHVGMSSMGVLLTIGMLVTLVATLGLLPALLRLGFRA